jgi:hypothetical protein
MSSTNSPSSRPSITSSAARAMASAISASSSPISALACAAAFLMVPSAWMKRRGKRMPLMGKFSTARCVCGP